MKPQVFKPIQSAYKREEDFNRALSENLRMLGIGDFDDYEVEAMVGTRRADIVAKNGEEILVIEVQYGKADWDHWGRLEAYARLKEATHAVLIAEDFEELMIVTSQLRNQDSNIGWYLIKAYLNQHDEFLFIHVEKPAIDIQTERQNIDYSEFWQPIREKGLFAGKPVPVRDEGWIGKSIKGASIILKVNKNAADIIVEYRDNDRVERRNKLLPILSNLIGNNLETKETSITAQILIPIIQKGRSDSESWDEIRELLTSTGASIYQKIEEIEN